MPAALLQMISIIINGRNTGFAINLKVYVPLLQVNKPRATVILWRGDIEAGKLRAMFSGTVEMMATIYLLYR